MAAPIAPHTHDVAGAVVPVPHIEPPDRNLTGMNRLLGATSGGTAGNARFILALTLTVAFVLLFGFVAVEYLAFGRVAAQSLVEQGWGAILAAFGLIVGLYFGARTAQVGG